jgi:hypothetical protein
MLAVRCCDICGRPENDPELAAEKGSLKLELDPDGLWICQDCRGRLILPPIGALSEKYAGKLGTLVGESAGAICRTLDLPYEPPYRSIIDAASQIAYDEDRFMSAWLFVTQWSDGTTLWRTEDGDATAMVGPDGAIHIEPG